jgi:hypothetical protein
MARKLWLVGILVALFGLCLAAILFFGMVIGLNGYIGRHGGTILLGYLGLLVAIIGLTVWGSVKGVQAVARRTGWSFWLLAPLTVVVALLADVVFMALTAIILLAEIS